MKALLSKIPGGPESLVLSEVPVPTVAAGQVRIAVRACALNYPDVLMIEGKYQRQPQRPFSPGLEIAGVIDSVAGDVSDLSVGQRVMARIDHGGLAEFATAPASRCTPIPQEMPFDEAAALQITYGTSYHALVDRALLRPNETLLVLGASGGVGISAVEIGHALGARVVAAASSMEKAQIAKEHGADDVMVYPSAVNDAKELARSFKATCPDGADVIYDPIGGAYAEPALRSIAWGGRYLVIGFAAGIPSPPLNLVLLKQCATVGVFWGAWVERFPEKNRENNRALLDLYRQRRIRPLVSAHFPLHRGGEAIQRLADRKAVGKLIVSI